MVDNLFEFKKLIRKYNNHLNFKIIGWLIYGVINCVAILFVCFVGEFIIQLALRFDYSFSGFFDVVLTGGFGLFVSSIILIVLLKAIELSSRLLSNNLLFETSTIKSLITIMDKVYRDNDYNNLEDNLPNFLRFKNKLHRKTVLLNMIYKIRFIICIIFIAVFSYLFYKYYLFDNMPNILASLNNEYWLPFIVAWIGVIIVVGGVIGLTLLPFNHLWNYKGGLITLYNMLDVAKNVFEHKDYIVTNYDDIIVSFDNDDIDLVNFSHELAKSMEMFEIRLPYISNYDDLVINEYSDNLTTLYDIVDELNELYDRDMYIKHKNSILDIYNYYIYCYEMDPKYNQLLINE
ncbi:MAG: hypothetical protein WBO70_00220 [Erysipelotrichaceae bacterium]